MDHLYISNISESSILICGDARIIASKSCVINLQKSKVTEEDKAEFSDYPIFQLEIPQWHHEQDIELMKLTEQAGSIVCVNNVRILSICHGSSLQVGSSKIIDLESRIKRIKVDSPKEATSD